MQDMVSYFLMLFVHKKYKFLVGATLYITGLSGSGKSTVGAALEHKLLTMGIHAYRLDGDNIRFGLNKGLGFRFDDCFAFSMLL